MLREWIKIVFFISTASFHHLMLVSGFCYKPNYDFTKPKAMEVNVIFRR